MAITYTEAREYAQKVANQTGFDMGVEDSGGWRAFMLPAKQYRAGHELRCEVVHCETLSKCRPGHGPCA